MSNYRYFIFMCKFGCCRDNYRIAIVGGMFDIDYIVMNDTYVSSAQN